MSVYGRMKTLKINYKIESKQMNQSLVLNKRASCRMMCVKFISSLNAPGRVLCTTCDLIYYKNVKICVGMRTHKAHLQWQTSEKKEGEWDWGLTGPSTTCKVLFLSNKKNEQNVTKSKDLLTLIDQ